MQQNITTTFLLRIRHNYTRLFEQSHACKAVVRNFPPPPPPTTPTTPTPTTPTPTPTPTTTTTTPTPTPTPTPTTTTTTTTSTSTTSTTTTSTTTTTATTPPGYWGHDVSAVGSAACSDAADPLPKRSWDSSLSGTLQPTPSPVTKIPLTLAPQNNS